VSNLRSNGAFGQIPTVFCFQHVLETPRLGHNFMDDSLEIEISEGRGCSSILLLSYGRLADLVAPNFRSNGAAGQISTVIMFHHLVWVHRAGYNVANHPLRKTTGQARGRRSILLDSYGRLADFVVSKKMTADENVCSNNVLLKSILTDLFHGFETHSS